MKSLFVRTLFALFLFHSPGHAQKPAADSVRVSISTSQGAEIGIDGDMSSTNMLRKKIAVGNHTVTVKLGSSFKRDFPLKVTLEGNHQYDFPISGKLKVDGTPAGRIVYIDGMPQGKSPVTIDLLGEHNLRVGGDELTFFDYNQRVNVPPFGNEAVNYTLAKRPPRLYGMAIANYSLSGGYGATLALCRRWGAFLRAGFNAADTGERLGTYQDGSQFGTGIYEKTSGSQQVVSTGLMFRAHKYAYVYVGGGYGEYKAVYEPVKGGNEYPGIPSRVWTEQNSFKGPTIDCGAIFKWRVLLFQVGYSNIFSSKNGSFGDFYAGIGFSIHRHKKSKF